MDNPRPDKVAVVNEVREKFEGADAALLTDYRGIDVSSMATLRRALVEAGCDYKIYKNSLMRLAVADLDLGIDEMLDGPTAVGFIPPGEDGAPGDPVPAAKAMREFSRTNDNLEFKGGLLGSSVLTVEDVIALAQLAPRLELLGRFAGGLAAPMQRFAGLLEALPRNFAYGLKALIDEGGGPDAPAAEPAPETPSEPDEPAAETAAAEPAAEAQDPAGETESEAPVPETEEPAEASDADAPKDDGNGDDDEATVPAEPEAKADDETDAEASEADDTESTETDEQAEGS